MIDLFIIELPGRVWEDYLDPLASDMAADIGLRSVSTRKRGRGWTAIIDDVTEEQARDLAEYLHDRGAMLVGQDPDNYAVHRQAIKCAADIRFGLL